MNNNKKSYTYGDKDISTRYYLMRKQNFQNRKTVTEIKTESGRIRPERNDNIQKILLKAIQKNNLEQL